MKLFHAVAAKLLGKNLQSTPSEVIRDQMLEPRPLPMGRKEFEEWSDRIISGALVPGPNGKVYQMAGLSAWDPDSEYSKHIDSQKFTLASMIMHLGPTESHKPDAFFIHSLRKAAVNEVAHAIGLELQSKSKARAAREKEAEEKKGKE